MTASARENPLPLVSTPLDGIIHQQLTSLDDTDGYASVWADLLRNSDIPIWGGRGKGGRGLARRTYQPRDIVVENVCLEYVSVEHSLPSKVLLDGATLKLLAGHVYALVGRNAVGKSTLLRRIHAGRIPGFPPHIATTYIPQELQPPPTISDDADTPLAMILQKFKNFAKDCMTKTEYNIELLEQQLEQLDDNDEEKMEQLCQQISDLQEEIERNTGQSSPSITEEAQNALLFFGIDYTSQKNPYRELSPGQRKKVALALALLCASTMSASQQLLLCLDEPTNHLDIHGLIKLRQLLLQTQESTSVTVLMVSHDTDLMNDVATDTITFSHIHKNLLYFPGNYWQYRRQKFQQDLHILRQQVSLDKKRNNMIQNIHYLQAQPAPRRGGNRKKAKAIAAQRKKLERTGIEVNEKGHRWTQQQADTAKDSSMGYSIKAGAMNNIDASTRKDLSTAELLQLAEASIRPPPDKAVQFV